MAVLPIRPTPFFANKNQAFWNLQLAGWGGATLLRAMSALANGQSPDRLVIILIATITGFSLSLILAVIYGQVIRQRPLVTWGSTALVLALATGVYAFIDSWVLQVAGAATDGNFASLFVGIYFIDLVLLGAWSALYYAINFFLQVEEQADRLERLEAQATSAQLAMLRYQLNPHFLFNTLNAISSLLLDARANEADKMLTQLSKFLRFTLDAAPDDRVPLRREIDAQRLYLEIEQTRFADRLKIAVDIDPVVEDALVPTMILQPLLENAVKYAVSQTTRAVRVTVEAKALSDDTLELRVTDTGSGGVSTRAYSGGGVGLSNIRARLAVLYGDTGRLEAGPQPEGGFAAVITMPLERSRAPKITEREEESDARTSGR